MQRWTHKAAGGTIQRLNPGLAIVRSRSKNGNKLIGRVHPSIARFLAREARRVPRTRTAGRRCSAAQKLKSPIRRNLAMPLPSYLANREHKQEAAALRAPPSGRRRAAKVVVEAVSITPANGGRGARMATIDDILSAIDAGQTAALERLFAFLAIPSISAVPAHFPDCERAADWLAAELGELGFEAAKRPASGRPMVVGHVKAARREAPHVLFYGHYDVQPVDPIDLWRSPPFEPKLEAAPQGDQIVARGACDDKGQLSTFLEACRAFKPFGGPPCHVTALFEGEEETGSPSLSAFLADNAKELKADIALASDEVILTGASRDLHSGLYGGMAVNPIHVLARILGDLHDDNGAVAIPGFYDGVEDLPQEIADQWNALDFDAAGFLRDVSLTAPAGERDRTPLELLWSRPTCEVNGILGGYTGEGTKTVLPAKASAKLTFRLV